MHVGAGDGGHRLRRGDPMKNAMVIVLYVTSRKWERVLKLASVNGAELVVAQLAVKDQMRASRA